MKLPAFNILAFATIGVAMAQAKQLTPSGIYFILGIGLVCVVGFIWNFIKFLQSNW